MAPLNIQEFWSAKLAGSSAPAASKLDGWTTGSGPPEGFIEPSLKVIVGDPETARLFFIAAPGAVGKTSYAAALAGATQSVVVDLAKTDPLGGNFFTGGLSNAFGYMALADAAAGKIALIVDALDEAQMRATPEGYESGLADIAAITDNAGALPAILLGRAIAAEEAYLLLAESGRDACLLEIQFFDDGEARTYIDGKLPFLAARDPSLNTAYASHKRTFHDLAHAAREKLIAAASCNQTRFSGYAPVLDAICEFTLDPDSQNPKAKLSELSTTSPIELIHEIITSILERERGKLRAQFRERHPDADEATLALLYKPEEQLRHVAATLFGSKPPLPPLLNDAAFRTTYNEMVERFAPQHPFLSSSRAASNPVFAAYLVAWALRHSDQAEIVRKSVRDQPTIMSGIFFDMYEREMGSEGSEVMPLADVGILYQALNSQIAAGQRVQLEVVGRDDQDSAPVEISFEILEKSDPETGEPPDGKTWGPYLANVDTMLELRSPFSNIYIDAPIAVQLGDGKVQQIGAPTELSAELLFISAEQVLVVRTGSDGTSEAQTVSLIAGEADCGTVQIVNVKEATLSVSWPGAKAHPWTSYAIEIVPAADENVDFMRRRLRKILTAFRSHSKGALRRLAAKIDHIRMTKDARGKALVDHLINDGILVLLPSGKFYELDPAVMARKLCVNYHDLAQSRFSPELDSYLLDVSSKAKA